MIRARVNLPSVAKELMLAEAEVRVEVVRAMLVVVVSAVG